MPQEFGRFRVLEAAPTPRFRKDILRVGTWRVGDEPWKVTRETLGQIVNSFNTAKSRGLDCPVVWNHSLDARDRIGKVTALSTDGQTLFADLEIPNAEEARKAQLCGVSVGHADLWVDGSFNEYPEHLVHLGIVNHPVVSGQGPFKPMSLLKESNVGKLSRWAASFVNGQPKMRKLADGEQAASTETVVQDIASGNTTSATDATAEQLVPLFKELFELVGIPGLQLSDSATDETLLSEVKLLLNVAKGMKGGDDKPSEDAAKAPVEQISDAAPEQMAYASLLRFAKGLKTRVLAVEMKAQTERQLAFTKELDTLCTAGVLNTTDRDAYLDLGKSRRFDLSILNPLKTLSAKIPTNSKTRQLANSGEPTVGGKEKTPEEAGREFFGIKEKKSA